MSDFVHSAAPAIIVTAHYAAHALSLPLCRREIRALLHVFCHVAVARMPIASSGSAEKHDPFYAPHGIELHIVDDARMRLANSRYSACNGPTNVLSFPNGSDAPGVLLLSTNTLQRECLFYGQEPMTHLVRLLAHGTAHLCGLDHGQDMDHLCASLEAAGNASLEAAGHKVSTA